MPFLICVLLSFEKSMHTFYWRAFWTSAALTLFFILFFGIYRQRGRVLERFPIKAPSVIRDQVNSTRLTWQRLQKVRKNPYEVRACLRSRRWSSGRTAPSCGWRGRTPDRRGRAYREPRRRCTRSTCRTAERPRRFRRAQGRWTTGLK